MADAIQGGDGTPQPVDLSTTLADLDNDTPTPPAPPPADDNQDDNQDGTNDGNDDGTDKGEPKGEGDKDDQGQDDDDQGDDGINPEEFYQQVNQLHGFEDFKVEYPEGVDPLSPEGLHIREKALIERAQTEFDEYLRKADPRAYAYMLHRQAGGADEDFMATKTLTLPDVDTFKNSVDLQKQVYLTSLVNKGIDEDSAKVLVEKAISDQKLLERSEAAYKEVEEAERLALVKAEKAAEERRKFEADAITSVVSSIEDVVMNSKVQNIVIPDAKRAAFAEHIKEHLFFDGKQFFLNKPISKENLAEVVQAEYFGFVKGNLNDLVERRAQTQRTKQFRLGVSKTKQAPRGGNDGSGSTFVPLSEV